jgi:phospholipid-binding lipoprotein MlaA
MMGIVRFFRPALIVAAVALLATPAAAQPLDVWSRLVDLTSRAGDALRAHVVEPTAAAFDGAMGAGTVGAVTETVGRWSSAMGDGLQRAVESTVGTQTVGAVGEAVGRWSAVVGDGLQRAVIEPAGNAIDQWLAALPPLTEQERDPWEHINRANHGFNRGLQTNVLDPVAVWIGDLPSPIRQGAYNFFNNLREPVTTVNSVLIGDFSNVGLSAGRFVVNSTVGLLGVLDVATDMGLKSRREDLGRVLCAYGVPSGPYLVLPVFGPSNARDAVGFITTNVVLFNTMGLEVYWPYRIGDTLVQYTQGKPNFDQIRQTAVDDYAIQRSVYTQFRDAACQNGKTPELPRLRDLW